MEQAPALHARLQIRNKLGLHMRAAQLLVKTAERFNAEVTLSKDGKTVNGRSIMGVMMLAAEQGSEIEVTADGPQAAEVLEALRELVEAGFHEKD